MDHRKYKSLLRYTTHGVLYMLAKRVTKITRPVKVMDMDSDLNEKSCI